jgi:hypothetical protein
MSFRIKVHTYSGYKADEYPRGFEYEGNKLTVLEIRSRWLEPSCEAFRVLTDDGKTYIIKNRHGEDGGWELHLVK